MSQEKIFTKRCNAELIKDTPAFIEYVQAWGLETSKKIFDKYVVVTAPNIDFIQTARDFKEGWITIRYIIEVEN